jgi:peptidoglycan/xylan/chitin deacetylase (PgdA/CDA1 family)
MKNNGLKLFAVLLITAVITGCVTENGNNKSNNGNGDGNGGDIVNTYTKAEIEAEVEAHWQEYGYTVKPTKYIAISFDDGPCPASDSGGTAALLTKLEELKVKAAFFVIGSNIRNNKSAARAIFEAGHELGNHSDGYNSLGGTTAIDTITKSLNAASLAIKETTGKNPVLFRAPNLNHGNNLFKVCEEMGMALIDGSAHNDWPGNSEAIKNSVLSNPQDGGIIILHDNNTSQGNTMSVLPEIIGGLRQKGFWILTVSQLAAVKEKSLEAGERYSSIY